MQPTSTLAQVAFVAMATAISVAAQKPVIDPRGVVNASTLIPAGWTTPGGAVAPGSIASIFGQNLSPATAAATQVPLPTSLAGVSVLWHTTTNGVTTDRPLPLFYVSPGQINFQIPNLAIGHSWPVIVQTPSGSSDPVMPVLSGSSPGIFVQDGSGCGPAWIFNVAQDGAWSLNSPDNSVEPGGIIVVLGTGLGPVMGVFPDGQPTPSNPLPRMFYLEPVAFDIPTDGEPEGSNVLYASRAPGMIGVDQFNLRLPGNTIEGCGIPLRITAIIASNFWDSQPVPVNVHRGGGRCGTLPPPQSYAALTLQKTTTVNADSTTTTEQLNVSLSSAVGKRLPVPAHASEVDSCTIVAWPPVAGPSCPFPAFVDRPVAVGPLTITGPGVTIQYPPKDTDTVFQVPLPSGTIAPGNFTVGAPGGASAGPFSVTLPAMADIQFDNPVPDRAVHLLNDFTLKWTGGQENEVVRVRLTAVDGLVFAECARKAIEGTMTFYRAGFDPNLGYFIPIPHTDNGELTITLESSPASFPFTAPGLTLGGTARWTRIWLYPNIKLTFCRLGDVCTTPTPGGTATNPVAEQRPRP
jgi:uncharacterized protein (TIGR03437 family)